MDITTHYKGFGKYYFKKIIREIIKIGSLDKKNKSILDFGCGEKYLEKKLNKKILNYDINPKYTEISEWEKYNFDIIIFNHVLMYMSEQEFLKILSKIKIKNNNIEIIIGMGKESILNKMAAYAALHFSYLENTKLKYLEQKKIIYDNLIIIKKSNVLNLSEIFNFKF